MTSINVAAGYVKPACLSSADLALAQSLCAQSRSSGQEAASGLGANDYTSAIKSAPCDWAMLPACAVPPKPSMHTSKTPSIMTRVLEAPPPTVSVLPAPPPPAPPKSNAPLLIGGVLLAAAVLGGAIYLVEKH